MTLPTMEINDSPDKLEWDHIENKSDHLNDVEPIDSPEKKDNRHFGLESRLNLTLAKFQKLKESNEFRELEDLGNLKKLKESMEFENNKMGRYKLNKKIHELSEKVDKLSTRDKLNKKIHKLSEKVDKLEKNVIGCKTINEYMPTTMSILSGFCGGASCGIVVVATIMFLKL